MIPELIITGDGSTSLFNTELNVTYHSRHGALQESMHIYIGAGLHHALSVFGRRLNVFELGFGTGLNTLLSLREAMKNDLQIHYTSLEKYPVPEELFALLNYANDPSSAQVYSQVLNSPWDQKIILNPHFTLHKRKGDINDIALPKNLHLVYYDAFDPEATPDCWQAGIFERLFLSMVPGACLVTYCAKGNIKRLLKETGFRVEALPGPPGKREMTRAFRP